MCEIIDFMKELATGAGEIALGYFKGEKLQPDLKPDHSIVTRADIESDRFITGQIQKRFSADGILSEEISPGGAHLKPGTSEALWVVDPLDGTTNFSLGLPIWGVSIARLVGGFPNNAVVYFPLLNELYSAERGKGACLNGSPLETNPTRYRKMSCFMCCCRTFRDYNVEIPFKTRILGSATYNYCCVARGIAALSFEATPKIWDIAGVWLVVEEADAAIKTLTGGSPFPLNLHVDYRQRNYPTLAADSAERLAWGFDRIHPK